MFWRIVQLMLSLICGVLLIKWVPITIPFSFSELFVSFVLSPLTFFGAAVVFVFGILINGKLIQYILFWTRKTNPNNSGSGQLSQVILCYVVFINFILLLNIGLWQTVPLLFFSVLYGMISKEYKT